jgi:hypothetical protein
MSELGNPKSRKQVKPRKKLKDKNRWIHDLTAGRDIGKYNLNELTRHHNKIASPRIPDTKPTEPDDGFWDDYVNDLVEQMKRDGKTVPNEMALKKQEKLNWKGAWDLASKHGVKEYSRIKKRYEDQATREARDQLNRSIEVIRRHNNQSNRNPRQPKHYPALEDKGEYKIIDDESKHDNIADDTWSFIAPNKKDILKVEHGTVPSIEKYNLMPVNSRIRDNSSIDHLERIHQPSIQQSIKYETAYRPRIPRRQAPKIEIPKIENPFWLGINDPSDSRLLPPERQVMEDDRDFRIQEGQRHYDRIKDSLYDEEESNNEVSDFISSWTQRMDNREVEDLGNLSDEWDAQYGN